MRNDPCRASENSPALIASPGSCNRLTTRKIMQAMENDGTVVIII